jgi:hypothetical protein
MSAMRGRVHHGRVELEGELPEGAEVVVMAPDREGPFDLAEAEVAELEARIASADQGQLVSAVDLIQKLRSAR